MACFINKALLEHNYIINLHIVYECRRATKVELRSHMDHMA